MKIKRTDLVHHLQRIACGGQITEAVFSGAFGTTALTPSQQLCVIAPPIPKARALQKDPIGIAELGKLMRALAILSGQGSEAVDVQLRLEKHRLIVDEAHRGVLKLMTAVPKTIGTYIDEATGKKLLAKCPKQKDGIPLTRELVEGIRATFSLFKATEIELFLGPKGGKVRVGSTKADMAEFASDDLKADKEYSILLGDYFVDVLGVIANYNEALLCVGGESTFVLVVDGGYKYILSKLARPKDDEAGEE